MYNGYYFSFQFSAHSNIFEMDDEVSMFVDHEDGYLSTDKEVFDNDDGVEDADDNVHWFDVDANLEIADDADGEEGGQGEGAFDDDNEWDPFADADQVEEGNVPIARPFYSFDNANATINRGGMMMKAHITPKDHIVSLLAIHVRHKTSYELLMDVFGWLDKSYDDEVWLPTTKQALWNVINRNGDNINYSQYCEMCCTKIGDKDEITRNCVCGACGPDRPNLKIAPLRELLSRPNMFESLQYRFHREKRHPDAIEDIFDGEMYKFLSQANMPLADPNNYSFTFWADGVKIADSSRASSWPLFLQFNELSPRA